MTKVHRDTPQRPRFRRASTATVMDVRSFAPDRDDCHSTIRSSSSFLPAEDHYLRTRQELGNQLAVWLGGRAAEEIVFHKISTGGHNDLQHATDVARAMVAELGMSDAIGPVAFNTRSKSPFLPVPGFEPSDAIAEQTAREIDVEVKRLMTEAHDRALQILREHRLTLDGIVRLLLEREVVEGDEVRRLLAAEFVAPTLRVASA